MSSRACHQCFSIKQKCDRKSPCSRCNRLQLECTSAPRGNPAQVYRAAVVRRNRTGCDSCKKRKKKCDEAKPKCSDCQRLNLQCTRTISRQSPQAPSGEAQCASNSNTALSSTIAGMTVLYGNCSVSPAADEQADENVDVDADNRELAPIVKPFYEWLTGGSHHVLPDSIQDHEVLTDIPQGLDSPGFDDIEMPGLSVDPPAQSESAWLSLEATSIPFELTPSPLDQLSNRQDKHLFNHFTHIVSRSLSIAPTDDDNPFLKLMMPIALSSNVVMGAMLALSAIHLKHNGGYPEIVQHGLDLQTRALKSLNNLISSGSSAGIFKEQALATILLFCIIDIREGNSSRWSWHIAAAKTVITSAEETSTYTTAWSFLLNLFEYVDTVITISRCQPPLIDHDKLPLSVEDQDASSPADSTTSNNTIKKYSYNAVFGITRPLFRMIGEISALSSKRKDRIKPFFDEEYRKCASEINARLRAWEPPSLFTSSSSSENLGRNITFKEAMHAAISIKWASILRLHQIVDGYALPHPVPTECLQHILTNLQGIRVGSSVECLMVFPLIMAGSVALAREDRMTIRSRWLIMERTIGFGNIAKGGKLQQHVWEAMDHQINGDGGEPGKVTVNWASIRWYEYGSFVMF